jgi:DNA-binding HxlR family transcriptional regulator
MDNADFEHLNIPLTQVDSLTRLAAHMHEDGHTRTDPMREIFARLGDRWSMLLMQVLRTGPMRSAVLRRITGQLSAEGKLSQRIFTLQIRQLEHDGLVSRTVTQTVPISVDYALTDLGHDLMAQIDPVMIWIRQNNARISNNNQDK